MLRLVERQRGFVRAVTTLSGLLWGLLSPAGAYAAGAWVPSNNIEIIVGSKPGGGNDATAREVQRLLQMNRLVPVSASVVNKPGAGGAISLAYLNQQPNTGHYLAVSSTTLVTNQAVNPKAIRHADLTPLAVLFSDSIAFAVRAGSGVRDGRDFFERLKKSPEALSIGFSGARGNAFHIALALAARSAGVDIRRLKAVVFHSGGEAITALRGGHIDAIVTIPKVMLSGLESGELRVIGVSASRRLAGRFAGVPTWKEQGINSVFPNWRGVVGARGMAPQQVAYWDSVFEKLTESEEWKRGLAKSLWQDDYMNSASTKQYLDAQYSEIRPLMAELGLAQ